MQRVAIGMKTIYRLDLSAPKRKLTAQVNAAMGADRADGYVIWDDQNYPDHPNPLYQKKAYHMNVACGGVEEISPDHILKLMERPDCKHFIWISRDIGEAEPIRTVWVYAHEMTHLVQDLDVPILSSLTNFLRLAYPRVEPPKRQIDIPGEFDAELTAKELVVKLFGRNEYQAYVKRQVQDCSEGKVYFRRFEEIQQSWSGDPMQESIRILCRHREVFKRELQALGRDGRHWSFNIDELCRAKA